jgi:hypothetical protein
MPVGIIQAYFVFKMYLSIDFWQADATSLLANVNSALTDLKMKEAGAYECLVDKDGKCILPLGVIIYHS